MTDLKGCCSHHDGLNPSRSKCADGFLPDKLKFAIEEQAKNISQNPSVMPKHRESQSFQGKGFEVIGGYVYNGDATPMLDEDGKQIEVEIKHYDYIDEKGKPQNIPDVIYNKKNGEMVYWGNSAPLTMRQAQNMKQENFEALAGKNWDPNYVNNVEIIIRHAGKGAKNLGHVMIKIDGKIYGFYENAKDVEVIHKSSWKAMMGSFDDDYPDGNTYSFYTLNLSAKDIANIKSKLDEDYKISSDKNRRNELPEYYFPWRNCATYVVGAVNKNTSLTIDPVSSPYALDEALNSLMKNGDRHIAAKHVGTSKLKRFLNN